MACAVTVFGNATRSEPRTASREGAHSTGVESTNRTLSVHALVSRAKGADQPAQWGRTVLNF
jgi:hypothetical protein